MKARYDEKAIKYANLTLKTCHGHEKRIIDPLNCGLFGYTPPSSGSGLVMGTSSHCLLYVTGAKTGYEPEIK
jgi:hypothetical protein